MTLDTLLKPVKFVDEQVLRQYTKFGKKLEDKNIKPEYVGLGACLPSFSLYAPIPGLEFMVNMNAIRYNKDITSDTKTEISPLDSFVNKMSRILRLPHFIAGSGFLISGGIQIYNGLRENDNASLNDGISHLFTATQLLGLSTSMYLRDRDPKLLDKEPFWKKAYNWAKEKVGSLAPQPIPQPVPVQAYSTLDSYFQAQPIK